MRRSGWLPAALVAAALAGCGGDEESPSVEEVRKPPLTVPEDTETDTTDSTDTTETTETEPSTPGGSSSPGTPRAPADQPNPGNGGVRAPDSNRGGAEPPPDSPSNDTPPEPGSPAERFEQFCDENPGAC